MKLQLVLLAILILPLTTLADDSEIPSLTCINEKLTEWQIELFIQNKELLELDDNSTKILFNYAWEQCLPVLTDEQKMFNGKKIEA